MKNPFIQTGDTKKLALYGGIFGTSLAVFIWAVFPRKKKKKIVAENKETKKQ